MKQNLSFIISNFKYDYYVSIHLILVFFYKFLFLVRFRFVTMKKIYLLLQYVKLKVDVQYERMKNHYL